MKITFYSILGILIAGWLAYSVYSGNFWFRLIGYSIYVPIFVAFVWSLATIKSQLSKLEQQTKSKSLLQNRKLLYFYIVTYVIQMV